MKKKVIVAGHICLDITPVFPDGKVKSVEQVLSPGKLIQMGNADVHTGGAVANTGLAMKLLGADVSLMGKVGEDAFGDMILNILDGYDAKEGMIRDKESTTSYSVVLAIPGIDRIFLHHPGANHTFAVSDIDFDKVKEAALFHFGYPTLMESMYNNDGAELVHLMKSVQRQGRQRPSIWQQSMQIQKQDRQTGQRFLEELFLMWISLYQVWKNSVSCLTGINSKNCRYVRMVEISQMCWILNRM